MPEKDPVNWMMVWDALPGTIKSAILATAVAFLRVMYDGKEPRMTRRLLESVLCGAIALCVASLLSAAGISADYSTFAGGSIGLLGADQVRAWARQIAAKHVKDIEP